MNAHARFLPLRRSLYGQLTFTFLGFAALFLLLWGSYDLYRSSQSMEQQILDSSTELVNQADGTLSRSMNNLSVMLNSTLMSSDVVRLAISPDLREFENMKAGATVEAETSHFYKNGSEIYKKLSKFIFKNARIIFCQGIEYKEFLNEIGFKNAIYHPNYIKKENSLLINRKDNELFKFVYLGRVTKTKNIEFVIDVFEKVHSKIPGSVLYIIGGWDEDYKIELENRIKNANIENEVYFTGRLDFRGIAEELNTSHFFLFPSQNKFEGHSNALTEAMAFGLVPITSNYGFNKTVVGYKELVIEDFVVEKYAETAINIIAQGLWDEYSKKMMKRVEDNFSEEVVRENYIRSLKQLLYNSEKSTK